MTFNISSIWYPSSDFYSEWAVTISLISVAACYLASLSAVRSSILGGVIMVFGVPILFATVLFSEGGMLILKDSKEFGFPVLMRAYPMASDFLATYIALGASFLIAREATRLSFRPFRIMGWIESIGFGMLAGFELFLLLRRLCIS